MRIAWRFFPPVNVSIGRAKKLKSCSLAPQHDGKSAERHRGRSLQRYGAATGIDVPACVATVRREEVCERATCRAASMKGSLEATAPVAGLSAVTAVSLSFDGPATRTATSG